MTNKPRKQRSVTVGVYLDHKLREKLREMAKAGMRSTSAEVKIACMKHAGLIG